MGYPGGRPDQQVAFVNRMPDAPGRFAVATVCSACHSVRLVIQQGQDRDGWVELLEWMAEEQGMPEQPPARREAILDYLSKGYGRDRLARNLAKKRWAGASTGGNPKPLK